MRRARSPSNNSGPLEPEPGRARHAGGPSSNSKSLEPEDAREHRRADAREALELDLRERPPPRDYETREAEQDEVLGRAPDDADEFEAEVRDRSAMGLFDSVMSTHAANVQRLSVARRATLNMTLCLDQCHAVDENEREAVQWMKLPADKFLGDTRLRVVQALLGEIDERGFERSAHQVKFHDAFLRACSRVLYREEWAVHRSAIMRHHNWDRVNSEVMISTPRRFGKVCSMHPLAPRPPGRLRDCRDRRNKPSADTAPRQGAVTRPASSRDDARQTRRQYGEMAPHR